ncbi:MAG: MmcQ/YjbR family DNA-binding protein [Lentisphaeraceae bacterium]|nr:MmcQ/YjbR family DNA-binding protein [Lentisphaeraceae bacterium]
MNFEALHHYLSNKIGSLEELPFGPDVMVFKVSGKVFALISLNDDLLRINLKIEPQNGDMLRTIFSCIKPGYHMNKRHWITVELNGELKDKNLRGIIDDSYKLVVSKLTKIQKAELEILKRNNSLG